MFSSHSRSNLQIVECKTAIKLKPPQGGGSNTTWHLLPRDIKLQRILAEDSCQQTEEEEEQMGGEGGSRGGVHARITQTGTSGSTSVPKKSQMTCQMCPPILSPQNKHSTRQFDTRPKDLSPNPGHIPSLIKQWLPAGTLSVRLPIQISCSVYI